MPGHHMTHKDALIWVNSLLAECCIPNQICGGLAAYGYGVKRDIHDIDMFVPAACYQQAVSLCREHMTKPSSRYVEQGWDVTYFQCVFGGVKVEVGNAEGVQIQCRTSTEWHPLTIDFECSNLTVVLGVEIPLMPVHQLIAYKTLLGREVDVQDIHDLQGLTSKK